MIIGKERLACAWIAVLLVVLGACQSRESKEGYVVSGSIAGAADGDSVFIESIEHMEFTRLDTAIIQNGRFTFSGHQDSTVLRYISCITEEDAFSVPFFLENGEIAVEISSLSASVTGTETNNIYQGIRSKVEGILEQMNMIDADSTLTEELYNQRMDDAERAHREVIMQGMKENITNPVGIFLFKQQYFDNSLSENQLLFNMIPEKFLSDPELMGMKLQMEQQRNTDVSVRFTDLDLYTPQGQEAKLSDYVGKGKPVLVDFWASWCGPCRQAMPDLVKLYKDYAGKFEIVGISLDEDPSSWQAAIEKLGITWPQLSDLKGWQSKAALKYGINSIPYTLLIDNDGIIVARDLHGEPLVNKLEELINQ
ncbi:MAG: TlpA disulfide reductase family protein [Porphyromonadaceae bacterium]|nr:TlpA disulfide reductase family protein [Porphyromonadaceae bacterium]